MARTRQPAAGATEQLAQLAALRGQTFSFNDYLTGLKPPATTENRIMTDRLIIFDTTLRDGEQSPGAAMTKEEKSASPASWKSWVSMIEAGFAAASPGDADAIRAIAEVVKHPPL